MPPPVLEPRPKRQKSGDQLEQPQRQSKRLKTSHPPPEYWDSLSKIWLTKDALRELDRRNGLSSSHGLQRWPRRPLTRRFQATLKSRSQTLAPDPLDSCKPETRRKIERLSRNGGPDLSDLRNLPISPIPFYQSMSTRNSRSRKRRGESPSQDTPITTTKSSNTAYNRNFQQTLVDHGIYPRGYEYHDGRVPGKPNNWDEINERLARPRASLSPSRFSESDFQEFEQADTNACDEKPVISTVVPIIEGKHSDRQCVGGDYAFANLAPLTDTKLASARPDHFFGARPEQLHRQIREELSDQIVPTTRGDRPIAPNFFLEAKGPDGTLPVAMRQACYDGALGARGIHSLRSYKQGEPVYDNNAYTITSTYHVGMLRLYTTHLTSRQGSKNNPEYIMNQIGAWGLISNSESFRQGACAYRNARDWAKEQRNMIIESANERHTQPQPELLSSDREETSERTIAVGDSITSATSDEAEFQDAVWSFTQPNVTVEDPQTVNKNTRTSSIGSASGKSYRN